MGSLMRITILGMLAVAGCLLLFQVRVAGGSVLRGSKGLNAAKGMRGKATLSVDHGARVSRGNDVDFNAALAARGLIRQAAGEWGRIGEILVRSGEEVRQDMDRVECQGTDGSRCFHGDPILRRRPRGLSEGEKEKMLGCTGNGISKRMRLRGGGELRIGRKGSQSNLKTKYLPSALCSFLCVRVRCVCASGKNLLGIVADVDVP